MASNLSCVSSNISNCPLSLNELLLIESELRNGIISESGVSHLLSFFAQIENVPSISVCLTLESFDNFDIGKMRINTVLIAKEPDTTYVYSVLYKNKNGQLFYKHSNGTPPSSALRKKLQDDVVVKVNRCNDEPSQMDVQHWMALLNAFTIASIANRHAKNFDQYVTSKRFCTQRTAQKYSVKSMRHIYDLMAAKINVNEIHSLVESEFETITDEILRNVNVKAFVILRINNVRDRMMKTLRRKCSKANIVRFIQMYNASSSGDRVGDILDGDYIVRFLKEQCAQLRSSSALIGVPQMVQQWIVNNKCQLPRCEWRTVATYCILAMEHTLKLTIRDNQLMALVLFLMSKQHTFLEVKTGEGKTLIIALVAAVQVLLGHKVDIITCNDLLAAANASEMKAFFAALQISCAHNKNNNSNPYSCDVVYGSMTQWQFDYLRNCLDVVDEARDQRQFDCCILDEVDLLAVDNCKHVAKISKPFNGMNCLANIYRAIYNNDYINIDEYPKYLQPYCKYMESVWRNNRKTLENNYAENVNYFKCNDTKNGIANRIIPIDAENTGALMQNSVFSDGVQQFLEFKHDEYYTSNLVEILNSIFVSNHGFIRLYQQNVFGVSGTLGSRQEEQILKAIFEQSVYFDRIPTFQKSKFQQLETKCILEHEDKELKEIIEQFGNDIDTNGNECVFLGTDIQVRKRLNKVCKSVQHSFSWQFNKQVRNSIKKDQFNVNLFGNSAEQCELLNHINKCCGMVIINDDDLCRAKLIDKLIKKYAKSIGNKVEYIVQLKRRIIKNSLTIVNQNDTIISLGLGECESTNRTEWNVYIFNHTFDDTSDIELQDEFTMVDDASFFNTCIFYVSSGLQNIDSVQIEMHSISKHIQNIPRDNLIINIREIIGTEHNTKRAVLVVCRNISELNELKDNLLEKLNNVDENNVYTYTGVNTELQNNINSLNTFVIQCGQIILTTNIGGRGTDYKTSQELDERGGLHVMLTFLPVNERVQQQAFGRTARNGRPGTGQLVLQQIDVMADFNLKKIPDANALTSIRNNINLWNLHCIQTSTVDELRFKDGMAKCYMSFYKMKKQQASDHNDDQEMLCRLQDVNECWAFWLKLEKYKTHKQWKLIKVDQVFALFLKDSKDIIDGRAYFNPLYAVKRANCFCERKHFNKAQRLLKLVTSVEKIISDETLSECLIFADHAICNSVLFNNALTALELKVYKITILNDIRREYNTILSKQQLGQHRTPRGADFINTIVNERIVTTYTECVGDFLMDVRELEPFFKQHERLPSSWSSTLLHFATGLARLIVSNKEEAKAAFEEGYNNLKQLITVRHLLNSSLHFLWNLGVNYIYDSIVTPITNFIRDTFPFVDIILQKATSKFKTCMEPYIHSVGTFYNLKSQYVNDNLRVAIASLEMFYINRQLKTAIGNIVKDQLTTTKTVTVSQLLSILNEEAYNLHSFTADCKGAVKDFISTKLETFLCKQNNGMKYEDNMRGLVNAYLLYIETMMSKINVKVEKVGQVMVSDEMHLSDVSRILECIFIDNMLPTLQRRIVAEIKEANRQEEAIRARTTSATVG